MPRRAGIPVVRVRPLRAPSLACEPQLRLILTAAVVTPASARQRFVAACQGEHVAQLGATGCDTERYAAALVGTQAQRGGLQPARSRLRPPVPTYARPFPLTPARSHLRPPVPTYARPFPLTPVSSHLRPSVPTYARPSPLTGGSGLVLVPVQIVGLDVALAWPVIAHDCRRERKRRVGRRVVDAPGDAHISRELAARHSSTRYSPY